MKSLIYHLKDKYGNLIDYKTSDKSAKKLLVGHEERIMWFEKQGWTPINYNINKYINKNYGTQN